MHGEHPRQDRLPTEHPTHPGRDGARTGHPPHTPDRTGHPRGTPRTLDKHSACEGHLSCSVEHFTPPVSRREPHLHPENTTLGCALSRVPSRPHKPDTRQAPAPVPHSPTGRPRLRNAWKFFSGVTRDQHEGTQEVLSPPLTPPQQLLQQHVLLRDGEGLWRLPAPSTQGAEGTRTQGAARAGVPLCLGIRTQQREASRRRDPALSHPGSPKEQPEDRVERAEAARAPGSAWPSSRPTGGSARPPPVAAKEPSILSTVTLSRTTLWPTEEPTPCRDPGRPCAQESSEAHPGPLLSPVGRGAARGICL